MLYKSKYLSLQKQIGGEKYDIILQVCLGCILIEKNVREDYLLYNILYLDECIHFIKKYFPNLKIFKDECKNLDLSDTDDDIP